MIITPRIAQDQSLLNKLFVFDDTRLTEVNTERYLTSVTEKAQKNAHKPAKSGCFARKWAAV